MIIEIDDLKQKTVNVLNYYSKYYCQQFIECENLFNNKKGHFALFNLFALFENIVKSTLNDFESTFNLLNIRLKEESSINDLEFNFLNNNKDGIRQIRNILAHANLSKYDLVIKNEKITFPFTENETCLILYENLSLIISGIILKILKRFTVLEYEIDLTKSIENLNFSFITRTPEELMMFKAIPLKDDWYKLEESVKYRLVENSSDVTLLGEIFKGLNL